MERGSRDLGGAEEGNAEMDRHLLPPGGQPGPRPQPVMETGFVGK